MVIVVVVGSAAPAVVVGVGFFLRVCTPSRLDFCWRLGLFLCSREGEAKRERVWQLPCRFADHPKENFKHDCISVPMCKPNSRSWLRWQSKACGHSLCIAVRLTSSMWTAQHPCQTSELNIPRMQDSGVRGTSRVSRLKSELLEGSTCIKVSADFSRFRPLPKLLKPASQL